MQPNTLVRPGKRLDWVALFWHGLLLAALGSILFPLDPDSAAISPVLTGIDSGYPQAVSQQIYQFIKSAILWIPLGALIGFSGQERALRFWAPAVAALLLLVGLPLLPDPRVRDVLEIFFALPGLAFGLWLGKRTSLGRVSVKSVRNTASISPQQEQAGLVEASVGRGAEGGRRRRSSSRASAATLAHPFSILLGVGILSLVLLGLWDFPRWPLLLALALALYAVALWFRPLAWLVVIPAALPLLDLAPWTGRFFFDEFDLLMLVTLGVTLLRRRVGATPALPGLALFLFGLLGLSLIVSGGIGLHPLPALDANAFSNYWSPYNSLRLGKGFLWGGLIFLWMSRAKSDRNVLAKWLSLGMGLGLLGVGLVGAWEHGLFVGFEGRHETYRIFSTFSSMHTGGGHIEAYLVAALPFLWLATARFKDVLVTGPLMALTAYVMLYTVARGGILALAVVVLILAVASARLAMRSRGRRFVAPLGALLAVVMVVAAGLGGGSYFQKRFSESVQDWQTRVDHWTQAIAMADDTLQARLFGMGLGSFPRRFQERGPADNQPATFGFASETGNTYFRLGTGQTVYYAQRIQFEAARSYRLELDVRSRSGEATRLDTPVCEKQLLNSRQCEWFGFEVSGDGLWHHQTLDFSSAKVGVQSLLHRPPVELFFHHPGKVGVVDIDNVRLIGPDGRDVLCNGNFSAGNDCWFFKTHSHLPWHIKNLWAHVWFEQGWLGLIAFAGLTLLALSRLGREALRGHRLAWAWLASLTGLLIVGMFDSLLDAPRLATLLVLLILLGAGYDWRDGGRHRAPS